MKVYFLFGKAGAGKSYVGNFIQLNFNIPHFDAEELLTNEMKNSIATARQFTQEMINTYMITVKEKIKIFYKSIPENSAVVISQAAYRNINRLDILKEFPEIKFVMIHAESEICLARINARNNGVTASYAKEMEQYFELPEPGFNYTIIDNNEETHPLLFDRIQAMFE